MSTEQGQDLELAEVIRAMRKELSAAMEQGQGEDIRFRLGSVDLELRLQVSAEAAVDGGVKVWVLSLGGKHSQTSSVTHTLKLKLQPADSHGDELTIAESSLEKPG